MCGLNKEEFNLISDLHNNYVCWPFAHRLYLRSGLSLILNLCYQVNEFIFIA